MPRRLDMSGIRQATHKDAVRIAEIIVFNYRLSFYPVFRNDEFYFSELNVPDVAEEYRSPEVLKNTYVFDDGVVKGVIRLSGSEVLKLFVEPCLHGDGIGSMLLDYAVNVKRADNLWVLEKNPRAISFYERNGFRLTGEKKYEEDTEEYLLKMNR